MLSDLCLSVCLSVCLSCLYVLPVCDVRALWPKTLGRIKMKPRVQVGLVPGHIVLDENPAPPLPKWHSPQFLAHIRCGETAAWIKMSLGMELGLGPGDLVLDGDPSSPPQKGERSPQIFDPCLLRPNGWMDEAGTWHGDRPQPRRLCVRWEPSPLPKKRRSPLSNFRPISIAAKRLDASRCHLVWM